MSSVIFSIGHRSHAPQAPLRAAPKLTAATQASVVAFEVGQLGRVIQDGWSVVVHGRAERITDRDQLRRLEALALRPLADAAERPRWVRVLPDAVTGRRVRKRVTGQ